MVLLTLQFLARTIQAVLGLPLEDHRIKAAPVNRREWAPSPARCSSPCSWCCSPPWRAACGSARRSPHRRGAARDVPRHPARQAAGAVRLEHPHHAGAAGAAAVHPDGRDPVPSRLSRSLFQGLAPWAGLLPGRLLHVNVVGCTIFAAISGSSAATTQVVGRIALTELTEARLLEGHRDRLARRAPARSAS
jgi:hypothetical protein